MKEIEAKFADIDAPALRQKLQENGFVCTSPEKDMRRKVFVLDDANPNHYARVRDEGDRITMTVKNIVDNTIHGVYESEVTINDFDQGSLFLTMSGWQKRSYQETKREIWYHDQANVEVVIDTWPGIPLYCEIEAADEETVRGFSEKLGFDWKNAFFGGVDVLYLHHLNIPLDVLNMISVITFDKPPMKMDKAG